MMTKKKREERFASCEAVLNALKGVGPVRVAPPVSVPPVQRQQPLPAGMPQQPAGPPPKTYLTEAILVTIFCCLPFGIAAIVNASQAGSDIKVGNYEKAKTSARKAKTFINVSVWLAIAWTIISVITVVLSDM